jgi:hypothetical protein
VLQRSAFQLIGNEHQHGFGAGAVLHLGTGVVSISNGWSTVEGWDWTELVNAAAALFPRRALVGYEYGADLESALAAGFATCGPQRCGSVEPVQTLKPADNATRTGPRSTGQADNCELGAGCAAARRQYQDGAPC